MDVHITKTFTDSLKTLIRRTKWWNRIYRALRYGIPRFFKNIYLFRKDLWNHSWYDYRYTISIMKTSLEIMERGMHNGLEVEETRNKKIAKMQRAIQILNNIEKDLYIEIAEKELGEIMFRNWHFEIADEERETYKLVDDGDEFAKEHNSKVYDRSREIEENEWNELWDIFRGQDIKEFRKLLDFIPEKERGDYSHYSNWFDGSGLNGWWD